MSPIYKKLKIWEGNGQWLAWNLVSHFSKGLLPGMKVIQTNLEKYANGSPPGKYLNNISMVYSLSVVFCSVV